MRAHKPSDYYRDKVYSLTNLPTLPVIANELIRVTRKNDLSINQIIPIIEKDPPLALKVLKVANSAYYGIQNEIKSLKNAVVIIGMGTLKEIAVSFAILKEFTLATKNSSINWNKYWEHSAACGHIAQLLGNRIEGNSRTDYFSAGLLHDIGKLVLFKLDESLYNEAYLFSVENNIDSLHGEGEIFGINHTDVGYWISEKWGLPTHLSLSIGFHHRPEIVEDIDGQKYASVIQLADLVSNFSQMDFGTEFAHSIPKDESGWSILQQDNEDLKGMDFERFVMGIQDEITEIQKIVEMVKS